MTITAKELAGVLKEAASKIEELEKISSQYERKSTVEEIIGAMVDKGIIDQKSAEEKKKEIMDSGSDEDLLLHKKALELVSGKPFEFASPDGGRFSGGGDPLDSWIFG